MTIRRQPADFVVEEVLQTAPGSLLAPGWSRAASHAVYRLTKTSLTTPEAVQRLAKALRVKPGEIEYAGLKDKHARTVQHVSLPVQSRGDAARLGEAGEVGKLTDERWSAELIG